MQVKFKEIDKYNRSMNFLEDETIASIIKFSYDRKLSDKYDEWKLFSNHEMLNKIVNALYGTIKDKWDNYDWLGSLGSSGAPLTYLLSTKYNKDAIFINDDWGVTGLFQPIKPHDTEVKDKTVLLIDSVFESGITACNGIEILKNRARKENGYLKVDVLVVTYFPEYTDTNFVKNHDESILYYLYYWDKDIRDKAKDIGLIQKD